MKSHVLYARSPEWAAAGRRLDELVREPGFRVVKRTSRTLAGIVPINGVEVFVKRVENGSWLKGIAASILGSRASKTLRGVRILERAGFKHPRIIAAFDQHQGGAVLASYVVAEYLRRPKILSRFALADGHDFCWRRTLSEQLAQIIRRMHDAGCYTRDLQETNLMVEAQASGLKIYFTDLEDFRWLPLVPWRLRHENLVQLDRSLGRFVSRAHRLRFLHQYLGDKAGRTEARSVVSRLHRIRQRIERRRVGRRRSETIITPSPDPVLENAE
jgi:hypothetical protein